MPENKTKGQPVILNGLFHLPAEVIKTAGKTYLYGCNIYSGGVNNGPERGPRGSRLTGCGRALLPAEASRCRKEALQNRR